MVRTGLALTAAVLALGCFACSAVASTITWSSPALIDQKLPFAVPLGLIDVACPSVHLCVGTQARGVDISRNPLGGASTWSITALPVTPGSPLARISCASPRLCVAVSDSGQVFSSTDPTGGAGAWKGTTVSSISYPNDVSCSRFRFCVVADDDGVVVSTRPTRPHSWRLIRVGSHRFAPFASIACPSRRLCVGTLQAGGLPGGIRWTRNPAGPGRDWTNPVYSHYSFDAHSIACPSTRLCVAVDDVGNVYTSTNPARGQWKVDGLGGYDLTNVSCPSVHLCVSVGPHHVAVSTDPAGGAGTWRTTHQRASNAGMGPPTCASAHLCLATNGVLPGAYGSGGSVGDLVWATANPARGATSWASSYLDQGYNPLRAIACPNEQLCVGGDTGGNLVTSSAPAAGAAAWNVAPLPRTYSMSSLACPSASWCAATSNDFGPGGSSRHSVLLTSADPANAGAWTSTPVSFEPLDLSCPTATFCASSDYLGAIHISGNPSGGASAWSSQQLGGPCIPEYHSCAYDSLLAVSCPSSSFCATIDGVDLWTSTDPSTPGAVWSKSPLPKLRNNYYSLPNCPDYCYRRLYCPTQSLCLAASNATLETTSDPADPSPQWTAAKLPKVGVPSEFGWEGPSISRVSCVSVQLCVAVDQDRGYAFVGNPSDPNSWTATKIDYATPPGDPADSLTGVSCTPSGRCTAIDGHGNVIVGTTSG